MPTNQEVLDAFAELGTDLHRWHRPLDILRIHRIWKGRSGGGAPVDDHPREWTLQQRYAATRGERPTRPSRGNAAGSAGGSAGVG